MIESVHQMLEEWIRGVARDVKIHFVAPADMVAREGVCVYLLEMLSAPTPRGVQVPPLEISLRYLITAWHADNRRAGQLVGELFFGAMVRKDFELETGAITAEMWRALGVVPRPSLQLRVPVKKARTTQTQPRVRGRMAVRFGGMRPLNGMVLGPGRVPIMAAQVTLPSLRLTSQTDHHGRFHFAAVPRDSVLKEIHVNARGQLVSLAFPQVAEDAPLLIELNESQI